MTADRCLVTCLPVVMQPLDLSRVAAGQKVYLYSLDLLMSLSDTVDACPRLGVAAFSRSLMKRVSRNGCAIELTPDLGDGQPRCQA